MSNIALLEEKDHVWHNLEYFLYILNIGDLESMHREKSMFDL